MLGAESPRATWLARCVSSAFAFKQVAAHIASHGLWGGHLDMPQLRLGQRPLIGLVLISDAGFAVANARTITIYPVNS